MADTSRTRSQLTSLLADNNTRNITPQILRDGFETVLNIAHFVTPEQYGGGVDKTAAQNDTAFAACVASTRAILVPNAGVYQISQPIDLSAGGIVFVGAGRSTIIQGQNGSVPLLKLGGQASRVESLSLSYANDALAQNTAANAIEIYSLYRSIIRDVYITRVYRAMYIPAVGTTNFIFSCTVSDLHISRYFKTALDLSSFNSGSTGNVFSNIYTENWDTYPTTKLAVDCCVHLVNHSDSIFQLLNVEHGQFSISPVLIEQSQGITMLGLHLEDVSVSGWGRSLVEVYDPTSILTIVGMAVFYSAFAAGVRLGVIGAGPGCAITVEGLSMRNNTSSATELYLLQQRDSGAPARVAIRNANTELLNANYGGGQASTPVPPLRELNGNYFYREENGAKITFDTAAPTAGTWAVADRRYNTSPAAGGNLGWVCTTAGSPGTWKTFGTIES